MKTKLSLITLGLSAAVASSAFAGDIKPLHTCIKTEVYNKSLGTSATAKDIYTATCPAGTASYKVQVRDQAAVAKPIVNIKIVGGSGTMQDGFDANGGTTQCDLTGFSSYASKSGGTGPYTIEVWKTAGTQGGTAPATADGAENYSISEHCVSSAGVDLGNATTITNPQNQ